MKKLITAIITLALAACASKAPVYTVANCPVPAIPLPSHYPFYDLTEADASRPGKVMHACVVSLKFCERDNGILRKKLEGLKS